jgi:TPP-dependent 2-oxoacid decarboxylase
VNGEDTKPEIPVRTWGDLWKLILVIALIVGDFAINHFETQANTAQIQEIQQGYVRKDVLDPQLVSMQKQLDRIEDKLDQHMGSADSPRPISPGH